MNKFLQWLKSLGAAFTSGQAPGGKVGLPKADDIEGINFGALDGGKDDPGTDRLADTHANYTQAVLEGKEAGLIPNAVDIPPVVDDHSGLRPAAVKRVETMPDLNSKMNIAQSTLDQEIASLAQGDLKAAAALRMMAVVAPAYGDVDPNGAPSIFALVKQAQLSGRDIGTFYEMCHSHPVKALGVLYATEHFGFRGNPGAEPFPVHALLNRVEQALLATIPSEKVESFVLGKPKADYEAKLARDAERRAQNQRPEAPRVGDSDSPHAAIEKLSDGNERVHRTLSVIAAMAEIADRDSVNGAMGPLMTMDSLGITGEKVISLFEACGSNAFSTVAVLRARQLGFVPDATLQKVASVPPGTHIGGADVRELDYKGLLVEVVEALPNFSLPTALQGSTAPGARSGAQDTGGKSAPSVPKDLPAPRQRPGQNKGGVGDQ